MAISDNGTVFKSRLYERLARKYEIEIYYTPIFHQRANAVERKVQDFKKIMSTLMLRVQNKSRWPAYVAPTLKVMRGRRNAATGMSPAKALLGYELPKKGDWDTLAYQKERRAERRTREQRMEAIRTQQAQYNEKKYPGGNPDIIFVEGDLVMLRDERQTRKEFSAKWLGPCRIHRRCSSEVYEVERDGDIVKCHVDKLRPAPRGNPEREEDQEDSSSSGDSSSDSSLSDAERSEDEEDRSQRAEEGGLRDRGAAATRSQRRAESPRGVALKRTVFDTVEPVPGPSWRLDTSAPSPNQILTLDPEQYLEDLERENGTSHGQKMQETPTEPPPIPAPPPQSSKSAASLTPPSGPPPSAQNEKVTSEPAAPEEDNPEETASPAGKGSNEPPPRPPRRKRRSRLVIRDP